MTDIEIYALAEQLAKRFGSRDPLEIAHRLGLEVLYYPLGALKGLYNVCLGNRFIAVNEELSREMCSVVIAHEIGHDRLHREFAKCGAINEFSLYDMTSRPEMEANIFAANLLISDEAVVAAGSEGATSFEVAAELRIPHELLLIKLCSMKKRGFDLNAAVCKGNFLKN